MIVTGKTKEVRFEGRELLVMNQRCPEWTHSYAYQGNGENMHDAACGVFAIVHCVEWMTGQRWDPCQMVDYSMSHGGRGPDGTDRPTLLAVMQADGQAERMGFRYGYDRHLNDSDLLFEHIQSGGTALCNLRSGHIVALVKSRVEKGERQLLAIDSYSESAHEKVRDSVREVIPGSEIVAAVRNEAGLETGYVENYSVFWVDAALPRDFNLLHKL